MSDEPFDVYEDDEVPEDQSTARHEPDETNPGEEDEDEDEE